MSIKIKLKNIYEFDSKLKEPKLKIGSRILKIDNKTSFRTPIRAITQTDLRAKNNFPEIRSLFSESPVFVYEQPMNIDDISIFVRNNTAPSNIIRTASTFFRSAQHATLKMFIPSVRMVDYSELYKNKELFKKYLDTLIAVQNQLPVDILTLPVTVPLGATPTANINEIESVIKREADNGKQLNIVLDMGYADSKVFELLLNKLLSYGKSTIPIISFRHKPPADAIHNYNILSKLASGDVLFNIINIEKRAYDDTVSRIHDSQFNFGDLYSYRVRVRGGGPREWDGIKFFRKDLTVKPLAEILAEGKIEKIHNDFYSDTLVKEINSKEAMKNKLLISKAIDYSRIHEVFLSDGELKASGKFLKGSTVADYLDAKKKLKTHILGEITA